MTRELGLGLLILAAASGCLSAARRSSGAIGCPENMITISDESVGALGDHTWTAECQGETYYCSMNSGEKGAANVNCTPAGGDEPAREERATPAPPPEEKRVAPPTGFAGFDFGMQAEGALERCVAAEGTWNIESDPFTCSKAPVAVGFEGVVALTFCGGGLCSVNVAQTRADAEFGHLESAFVRLVKALRGKYGAPKELKIPGRECHGRVLDCVRSGGGLMHSRWTWPSEHEILLEVKAATDGATLALKYSAPSSLTRRDMPGL